MFVNARLLEGVPSGALEGWTQANVQPRYSSTGRSEVNWVPARFLGFVGVTVFLCG